MRHGNFLAGTHPDDGARVSMVSVAWEGHAYAYAFNQGRGGKLPQVSLFSDNNLPESEWWVLLQWLSQRRLVMHNASFDIKMLCAGTDHWSGIDLTDNVVWDSMLVCKELWPTEPVGLDAVTQRLKLGTKTGDTIKHYLKKNRLPAGRFDLVPTEIIGPYAATDARLTYDLYRLQLELVDHGCAKRSEIERELQVMKVLSRMEHRGVGFDRARATQVAQNLRERQGTLEKTLPFKPDAGVSSAKKYFYGTLGLRPTDITPTGQPQLNEPVLRKLVKGKVPGAVEYAEWRKLDQALSTYFEGWPALCGADGRLRTVYRQLGTASGRFSVGRVQLQAVPRHLGIDGAPEPKSLLRAKPGYELWELDLQGAELRAAAKMADCTPMLAMFANGDDLHGITATQLFDMSPGDRGWDRARQTAKRANFSCCFGVGPVTFRNMVKLQQDIDLSASESQRIVTDWRALYPEFERVSRRWDRFAERNRYVPLVNDRKRWFRSFEYTSKAWNQVVQSSLAELLRDWLIEVDGQWPGTLVLTVHDSLVVEVPVDSGEALSKAMAACGESIGRTLFDTDMPVELGRFGQ